MDSPTTIMTAPIVIGIVVFGVFQLRKYMSGGICHCTTRLDGKNVIITGSNTGIGKFTAKDLMKRGARVILACRNLEKAEQAKDDILRETGCAKDKCVVKKLDLTSFKSIRDFAKDISTTEKSLHILINNAGVMWTDYSKTEDGLEMQIGTNHFGHFLLTLLLLDLLKKSAPSRIVNVSSLAHGFGDIKFEDINYEKRSYSRLQAYQDSKLANVLFTRELSRRLADTNVTANSLHPGVVDSELMRYAPGMGVVRAVAAPFRWLIEKSTSQGSQTSIHVAVSPHLTGVSGKYFSDCQEKRAASPALKDADARRLWEMSEEITGVKL